MANAADHARCPGTPATLWQGWHQLLALLRHAASLIQRAQSIPFCVIGQVVDTTGAGDCFTAAYAVAVLEGQPQRAALRFAGRCPCYTV